MTGARLSRVPGEHSPHSGVLESKQAEGDPHPDTDGSAGAAGNQVDSLRIEEPIFRGAIGLWQGFTVQLKWALSSSPCLPGALPQ